VITALPLEKTPNRLALDPAVTDVGFAVKLDMVAVFVIDVPTQPVRQAVRAKLDRPMQRARAKETDTLEGFIFSRAICWVDLPIASGFALIDVDLSFAPSTLAIDC
jgi:hypothetical protein